MNKSSSRLALTILWIYELVILNLDILALLFQQHYKSIFFNMKKALYVNT